eukprot:jgi/Mesen1/4162/ME000219S03291
MAHQRKANASERSTIWSPPPKKVDDKVLATTLFSACTKDKSSVENEKEEDKEKKKIWGSNFGKYMGEKIRKLREQYDANATDALFG